MNNKNKENFIQYLYQRNEWLKTDELAGIFNLSPRTIRNYINEINDLPYSEPLIKSKNNSYRINKDIFLEFKKSKIDEFSQPETPKERIKYLLKELVYNADGLDIFDISDALFLSIPSIEKDLNEIRRIIKDYDLQLKRNKEHILLIGSETNKRKLMNQLYYEEHLHLSDIQSEFYGYDFNELKEIVSNILARHNLFLSEYTMSNVLLHIVISIERIKEENFVDTGNIEKLDQTAEYEATLEIANEIEKKFSISFDTPELYYLTLLLISKTTILRYNEINAQNIDRFIEPKYIQLTNKIVYKIKKYFFVDINDEEFKVKFTLHLKNLITRAKYNRFSKNPMTKKIKYSYPLIYDLSVFIANEIQKEEGIVINEDEIAYISFHLGAFFERKKGLESKVSCVVICPDYYGIQMELIRKLSQRFNDSLEIVKVVSSVNDELNKLNVDFIITTMEIPPLTDLDFLKINLFLTEDDQKRLFEKIKELKRKKYYDNIHTYLDQYFESSLFEKNVYFDNEVEAIKYMGNKLKKLGRIDDEYIQSMIKRESMSSTAFNNIVAIPHSMKMNAKKTTISIIINDKPQVWGDSQVQIIAMITMNEQERKEFRHIFDSFISILSEIENVSHIVKSKDYADFIKILTHMMKEV